MTGPITLLILDGWGISNETRGNAIKNASTPSYNDLLANHAHCLLQASGPAVGLPEGVIGNSEVGHLHIGAGRTIVEKVTRIDNSVADGSFFRNPVFLNAMGRVKITGGALHIMGLVSDGLVHASPRHLQALIKLAEETGVEELIVHPILDGRDVEPGAAFSSLKELEISLAGRGHIGVVCGRYLAMDRDNRWERIEKYWRALVLGDAQASSSAIAAVEAARKEGFTDEFVPPYVVTRRPIRDGDSLIFFNFRPDRARQITAAITQPDFASFERPEFPKVHFVCMSDYDSDFALPVAFPTSHVEKTLPELLSSQGCAQLHVAETEKYPHVTYFLNGGKEDLIRGEERIMVPSIREVPTYDLVPAMQTPQVATIVCDAIRAGAHPFIVANFANCDMVGHTGNMDAALKAVEAADQAIGRVMQATAEANGILIVTADHGNIEKMINLETGTPYTAHTTNPVPFALADFRSKDRGRKISLRDGTLGDIAPTVLSLQKMRKPRMMSGRSLISNVTQLKSVKRIIL